MNEEKKFPNPVKLGLKWFFENKKIGAILGWIGLVAVFYFIAKYLILPIF